MRPTWTYVCWGSYFKVKKKLASATLPTCLPYLQHQHLSVPFVWNETERLGRPPPTLWILLLNSLQTIKDKCVQLSTFAASLCAVIKVMWSPFGHWCLFHLNSSTQQQKRLRGQSYRPSCKSFTRFVRILPIEQKNKWPIYWNGWRVTLLEHLLLWVQLTLFHVFIVKWFLWRGWGS